jgi:hypothetical protein
MEPSALINANGSLTRSTGRRTTSAEYMTDAMREDLINTPVRTYAAPSNEEEETAKARQSLGSLFDAHNDESTELSSTYNSPTTTMNVRNPGVSTPTELIGWDPATSATPAPTPGPSHLAGQKTPLVSKSQTQIHAKGMMSAPPKQLNQSLFAVEAESGKDKDNRAEGDGKLKGKLENARRKTMGWKPRIGSPLGKF